MDKLQLRARLSADRKGIDRLEKRLRKNCKEAIKLLQSTDVDKRLELIDYLFADGVDEVIEYHLRKIYQISDLGFGELK